MGGVGAAGVTWAWFFPPTHPREVRRTQGDNPLEPPAEGRTPLYSPFSDSVCGVFFSQVAVEAGALAGVAGRAQRLHADEDGIVVAVDEDGAHVEEVAGGGPFVP